MKVFGGDTIFRNGALRNVPNVQFILSSAGPGCRDLWADCSAFLSCSRSSFNSEI